MYINYIDNVIELTCSVVEISNEEHGIEIFFKGENDLDYFLIQRHFDEDDDLDIFYTEGCDNTGHWTFLSVTLDEKHVIFSINKMPVKIILNINPIKYTELKETLRTLIGMVGSLNENGSR